MPKRSASTEMIVPAETKVMVRMRLRGPGGSRVISLSGINRQMIATAATDPAIRRIKMTYLENFVYNYYLSIHKEEQNFILQMIKRIQNII